jgi:hypothetical protein
VPGEAGEGHALVGGEFDGERARSADANKDGRAGDRGFLYEFE